MVNVREPYLLDGVEVPSVTEVLSVYSGASEHLMVWSNNLGKKGKDYREELDRTAQIGSCAHMMIEFALMHAPVEHWSEYPRDIMDQASKIMNLFDRWCGDKEIRVINQEKRMVSRDFACGGTYDLLCQIDDGPVVLVDFKTASAIRPKNIAQVAAYVDMVNETEDRNVEQACILRVGRDGTSEELWVDEAMLDRGRHMFLLARQMYTLHQELTLDAKMGTKLVQKEYTRVPLTVLGVAY